MKFFVLGCNGMAGHTISLYLKERGHEVSGFDLTAPRFVKGVAGNAFDTAFLQQYILDGKFDTVINCIGILNQFAESNDEFIGNLNIQYGLNDLAVINFFVSEF